MITRSRTIMPSDKCAPLKVDLLINCIGYETRALHATARGIVEAKSVASISFPLSHSFSYRNNLERMRERGAKVLFDYEGEIRTGVLDELLLRSQSKTGRVAIDISSMNRTMIATCVLWAALRPKVVKELVLLYSPREFSAPPMELPQIEAVGPVLPELAGVYHRVGQPVALMISVGYEHGIAVGLINKLEPQVTLCLYGIGADKRFEEAVSQANSGFQFGVGNVRLVKYSLSDINEAYATLENITHGSAGKFRLILVPLGPKIIAAIATMLTLKFFGDVALWRVVEGRREAIDALPDGRVVVTEVDAGRIMSDRARAVLKEVSGLN